MTPGEFELLVKNAESGNTNAMYRLGMLYRNGKKFFALSVPEDREKSHQYFEAAAEGGHALGAWRIGARKGFPFLPMVILAAANLKQLTAHVLIGGVETLSRLIKILFKSTAWLIGIAIVLGIVSLIFSGIAALPVSVAIIIGAVIIALAISK